MLLPFVGLPLAALISSTLKASRGGRTLPIGAGVVGGWIAGIAVMVVLESVGLGMNQAESAQAIGQMLIWATLGAGVGAFMGQAQIKKAALICVGVLLASLALSWSLKSTPESAGTTAASINEFNPSTARPIGAPINPYAKVKDSHGEFDPSTATPINP